MKNYLFIFLFLVSGFTQSVVFAKDEQKAPKPKGDKVFKVNWAKSLKTNGSKKRYFPDMSSPVVSGGRIFVGTHGGDFYAIDEATGKMVWHAETGGPVAAPAVVVDNQVVVGNNEGLVSVFDAASGQKINSTYVGGEVLAQPAADSTSVYVITSAREVFAISRSTGQIQWSAFIKGFDTKFTMRGNSSLVLSGGRLFVGMSDGQVVCLSISGGQILWTTNLATGQEPFKDIDATLLLDSGDLYAVGYFGYLVKLNATDGHIIYKKECRSGSNLSESGSLLAVTTTDGRVIVFDKSSGQRQWDTPLYSQVLSAPLIQGNTVVVGARAGQVFILSLQNGVVLQSFPMGSGYMGQAVGDGNNFYILSATAKLYSFSPR